MEDKNKPKRIGRESQYNFDLAKEICEQVACGENIKRVLASNPKYPSFPTWCKWKRENQPLLNLYVNSIADKAEMVDAQIDEIWEGCRQGLYDASTANVLIQTLKWKAAKYYPKMFGTDRQEIEHKGISSNQKIDYSKLTNEELDTLLKIQAKAIRND